MFFRFMEPGPLIDGELELVAPDERWVDPMLASASHPACAGDERAEHTTRQVLTELLRAAPAGHHPGDLLRNRVPAYTFWMRLRTFDGYAPPVPMAGTISLRVGHSRDVEQYFGHIGYNVLPPARGRHFAERACRLMLPLARMHGMKTIWITCNPDNLPSRRTCERLGAKMIEVVPLPPGNALYQRGERQKCRYRLDL